MKHLFKENILPLSEISIRANHNDMRRQKGADYYLVQLNGKTFNYKIIKEKTWDPHVHALQELLPQNDQNKIKILQANLQALISNSGLITRLKLKIGCSRVNNTL